MVKSIWRFMGSINLTIWLLVFVAVNLAVGSLYARLYPRLVGQLDYLRFQEWISPQMAPVGWWIFSLFLLIFLLAANTLACTMDRLLFISGKRQKPKPGAFFLDLSPSLMHICFIIIIFGHALSQFTASVITLPVHPGAMINLAATGVTVENRICTHWEEPRLKGYIRQCSVTLTLQNHERSIRKELSVTHPIFWEDYIIHLNMSGKGKGDMLPKLNLVIRKYPGLTPMLVGGSFFCIIILWYFINVIKFRRGDALSC